MISDLIFNTITKITMCHLKFAVLYIFNFVIDHCFKKPSKGLILFHDESNDIGFDAKIIESIFK